MSRNSITSADGVFTLTVTSLFSAPITLENWGTDKSWTAQSVASTTSEMSLDGYLNKGFKHVPVDMTLTLSASSASNAVFEAIEEYQQARRTVVVLGGELRLPGLNRLYTFDDGHVTAMSPLPTGGATLGARDYTIRWRRIIPAGL